MAYKETIDGVVAASLTTRLQLAIKTTKRQEHADSSIENTCGFEKKTVGSCATEQHV
jgi:hypothetical protein